MSDVEVALDLTPAITGVTGVARYARELARELPSHGVVVRGFAVGRGVDQPPEGTRRMRVPLRVVRPIWRIARLPRAEWLSGGGSVVHSVDLDPPPTRLPLVATIHDVAALDHPDLHPPEATAAQRRRLEAVGGAARIIAVSQATAAGLARYGVDPERVTVVPEGVARLGPGAERSLQATPYLLAVGQLTARKDYPTLLRALALDPARDLRLVIVGPPGYRGEEIPLLAQRLGVADRVDFVGRAPDSTLATLYRHAVALCFSSVAEGFGLPLVEAMQAGIPVVASDIDIAHEVVGDAGLYATVGDAEGFAEAMARVSTDGDLRSRLAAVGRERAASFTWERAAVLTADVYRKVAGCE